MDFFVEGRTPVPRPARGENGSPRESGGPPTDPRGPGSAAELLGWTGFPTSLRLPPRGFAYWGESLEPSRESAARPRGSARSSAHLFVSSGVDMGPCGPEGEPVRSMVDPDTGEPRPEEPTPTLDVVASDEDLRRLLAANLDPHVFLDLSGGVTDLNRRMEKLVGASRDGLVGRPFQHWFEDPAGVDAVLPRLAAGRRASNVELSLRNGSGGEAVLSFNFIPVVGPGGGVRGILGAARDITRQKQLDAQLRESQTYNRGLIEASPDALVTVDPGLRITDVNEQMVQLSGWTRKHLIGSPFPELFTDPALAREGVRTSLDQGSVRDYEMLLRTKEGRLVPVAVNAGTFYDMVGSVRGVLVAARDVSAHKAIEAELREAQNYTRGLVESGVDALMTTDVLGRLTDVNRQVEVLTGLPRAQLLGTPFRNYFTDGDRADEAIRRVLHEDRVLDYELTLVAKGGTSVDVSCNATTFRDTEGRLAGVFAAARDITDQKRLRDQLEQRNRELEVQNRRVEEANRLKTEFLANMSHELRTPLNSIIGFSEFLYSQPDNGLTPEQREQVGDIYNCGNLLLQLINDILDLSKIESGKMAITPTEFSPRQAVDEVCSVVKPMIEEKHLELRTDVGPDLESVTLDPLRFKQVLFNLLSNAAKFTEPGGRLEVAVARRPDDRFELRVRDTGIGIAAEDLPRLFRQFEQLDSGPGRRYQGSGLGLSLTHRLVELHGGTIDVESQLGVGTTFTVNLPVRVPAEPASGLPPTSAP
jgi:PAS domain S-box-containing protein